MSSVLAIAGVTAVLQDMIGNRLATEPIASTIGTAEVTALPPDRIDMSGTSDPTQVNVFLQQVSRNTGWANIDAPVRNSSGGRVAAPPMVLDLHYLITVYGDTALRSEMLTAQVAQTFHEDPVPSRQMITQALNPTNPPAGFPAALATCGLADQFEHLRITPEMLSNEEISKLWSALQARYRPTLAFRVTTVIIDSPDLGRPALPAQTAGLRAGPLTRPQIRAVQVSGDPNAAITPGAALEILGQNLTAGDLRLMVGDQDLTAAITATQPDRIALTLPAPGALGAGVHTVSLRHLTELGAPGELRDASVSNPALMVLAPTVTGAFAQSAEVVEDGVTLRDGTLTLTLAPEAGRMQRVTALLNATDGSGRSYGFRAPDGNGIPTNQTSSATVEVPLRRVVAGTYLLRVQVDAGESRLSQAGDGMFNAPLVTI